MPSNVKVVYTSNDSNPFNGAVTKHMVTLMQEEKAPFLFTLVYGLEIKSSLTYAQACMALGSALLHHACCEGKAINTGL